MLGKVPHPEGKEASPMFDSFRQRLASVRQSDSLVCAGLLSAEMFREAFGEACHILDSAHIYTASVTLWTFLTQGLSQNHSCEFAVTKLISFLLAQGKKACSSQTGAYCLARDKLAEDAMQRLQHLVGNRFGRYEPHLVKRRPKRCVGSSNVCCGSGISRRKAIRIAQPPW